jgi:hypothetical protein
VIGGQACKPDCPALLRNLLSSCNLLKALTRLLLEVCHQRQCCHRWRKPLHTFCTLQVAEACIAPNAPLILPFHRELAHAEVTA